MHILQSLLFTSLLSLPLLLHAQGSRPAYESGQLYLKVYNHANLSLPTFEGKGEVGILENQGLVPLASILRNYGTLALTKPFFLEDASLQNVYHLSMDQAGNEEALIQSLEQLSYIEYAEKVPVYYYDFTPNDYSPTTLYHLNIIDAPTAWDNTQGNPEVTIAVVDAAVLLTHADLAANIWTNPGEIPNNGVDDDGNGYVDDVNGWDAADGDNNPNPPGISHDHGTLVSGCASAVTNNGTGISSIGFSCSIIPVKAKTNSSTNTSLTHTLQGVQYAIAAGADVINMSYGGSGYSNTAQLLMNTAHNSGILLVSSSGNTGNDEALYPSAYNHVISVAATNNVDRKASWSTYNSTVDVSAPGDNVRTTGHTNTLLSNYQTVDGTSFSSPIVAGLAGLMLSVNPCLTTDEIETTMKATARVIDTISFNLSYAGKLGAGRINAAAAVAAVIPTSAPSAEFVVGDTVSCDGSGAVNFFYLPDSSEACPSSFFWSSNGQSSTNSNATFTYATSGTYSVTLVVNNAAGTSTLTRQVNVTVGSEPVVEAGGDSTGRFFTCFGQTVQLNGSSTTPNVTYRWTPTSGLSDPSVPNPTFTAVTNRTYTLTVTDSIGCNGSDDVQVIVGAAVSINAGADQLIQKGDSVQLNATGNVTIFSWAPDTFLSASNIANPVCKPTNTITYTVTGRNAIGCEVSDEITVTVEGTWPLGIADDFAASAGTLFAPYPNPAQSLLHLSADFSRAGNLQIGLYGLDGREVNRLYAGKVPAGTFSLDWQRDEAVSPGVYLVLWRMNGALQTQKVWLR